MPLTPEEIREQKFSINLRGYEKEQVDAFLQQVAGDYEAAISAIASASDPYGALGKEVGSVLRSAQESAEKIRRDAEIEIRSQREAVTEEATEALRQANEAATATLEEARDKAFHMTQDAERRAREAEEVAQTARQLAQDDAVDIRRQAAEEAAATLDAAASKAEQLTKEAQRHARELRQTAERQGQELLRDASARHESLQAHENELQGRVEEVDKALARLRSELRSGAAPRGDGDGATVVDVREPRERTASSRAKSK